MKLMLPFDGLLHNRIIPIATVTAVQKTVKLIPMRTHLVFLFCSFDTVTLNFSPLCFRLNSVKGKKSMVLIIAYLIFEQKETQLLKVFQIQPKKFMSMKSNMSNFSNKLKC